jgi:hypothetical protein
MESQNTENTKLEITQEELDKLDADLLEIDILYRSRCVQTPQRSNVVVREIQNTEK